MIQASRNVAQRGRNRAQQFNAVTASLPAPTGGWNARDSLANMKPTDAAYIMNWWGSTTDLMVRKGYQYHATGLPTYVESILTYNGPTSAKMFAASGTAIYDVTSAGAVGAAAVSGLTNARWQYQNFATAGGNFLLTVNGADKLRGHDGTVWYVDGDGAHDITGVNTANCIHINVHARRVWLVEKNTLKVWYLPIDSIAGAAAAFDLRSRASLGGSIMAMGTWTIDSGTGSDDHAVFITTEGQVIVYRGIDPSNEVTWSLIGVYEIGSPFNRRCMKKFGGDLLVLTVDGLVPLSTHLLSDRVNTKSAVTDKIRNAMIEATALYGSNFGWDITTFSKANQIILNVPVAAGSNQQQYVMNAITGSWFPFSGWDANCFELFDEDLYFGGNGFVAKAWTGFADNTATINATALQAFNYFGARGQSKRYVMMRPIISSSGNPAILANVNVDFTIETPTTPLSFIPSTYGLWDTALWDVGIWGGGLTILKYWQTVNGVGYCAAPVLQAANNGIETHWMSTDLVMESGGIL